MLASASSRRRPAYASQAGIRTTGVDPEHPRIRALAELSCRVHELDRPFSSSLWTAASLALPARYALDTARRGITVAARALMRRRPDLVIVAQGANFDGAHLARLSQRLRLAYVLISQKASELQWRPANWVRAYLAEVFASARLALFVSEHNRRLTEEQISGCASPTRRSCATSCWPVGTARRRRRRTGDAMSPNGRTFAALRYTRGQRQRRGRKHEPDIAEPVWR